MAETIHSIRWYISEKTFRALSHDLPVNPTFDDVCAALARLDTSEKLEAQTSQEGDNDHE